ncbi:hypothetical protein [Vibrio jasicida]|uniref:Uncharacterized protein n=1 Tax=Vibrio jasicida TaxID=766224 RepID=A0ABW7JFJ9_9VIBR
MSKFIPGECTPNKFVVFEIIDYYPDGGLHDIEASFDSIEDAKEFILKNTSTSLFEVVDRDTWLIVFRGYTEIYNVQ